MYDLAGSIPPQWRFLFASRLRSEATWKVPVGQLCGSYEEVALSSLDLPQRRSLRGKHVTSTRDVSYTCMFYSENQKCCVEYSGDMVGR